MRLKNKNKLKVVFKLIFILCFALTTNVFSQGINGIYKSGFTSFNSINNPSDNFSKVIDDMITIEIYDAPYTRGYVAISGKTSNGETVTFKFVVKSKKKYLYEDGETYLYYDGVMSLSEIETKTECTIAFDSKTEALIITYNGGTSQVWELKKIQF